MKPEDVKAKVEALVRSIGKRDFPKAQAEMARLRAALPGGESLSAEDELRLADALLARAYDVGKPADVRAAKALRAEAAAKVEASKKVPRQRTRAVATEEDGEPGSGPKSLRIQRAMLAYMLSHHTEEEALIAVASKDGIEWQGEKVRCSPERARAELAALGRALAVRHDDAGFNERIIAFTSDALLRIAKAAEAANQFAAARESLMARVRLHATRSERFSRLAPGRDDDNAAPVSADEDAHTRASRDYSALTDTELEERTRRLRERQAMFGGNRE